RFFFVQNGNGNVVISQEKTITNIPVVSKSFFSKDLLNGSIYFAVDAPKLKSDCECRRHIPIPSGLFFNNTSSISDVIQAIQSSHGVSTCSNDATLRGPGQYVASYSLYGDFHNEYHNGVQHVVKQVGNKYPGWIMRLYHDLDITEEHKRKWLCNLACQNPHLDLCNIRNIT
ncbi:unnamed protein product, partial [Meganyctiphanes norvegica]